ncbi:family 1 glycosylhydrolase [Novosphingobium sp.]|uniref:glycoside hydrolase family 1 protein n=1 Tax=Novosphingobium sp. TaxID=1874826 RepID=UPI0025E962C7|nr:family 1 glycosylhydrolase [Novosphingobium sp.]
MAGHERGDSPSFSAIVTRRQALGGAVAGALAVSGPAGAAPAPRDRFVIGVAAAAAQTESRNGRGRSNWDVFADTPGKIHDGSTNARCTEFDTRYATDLDRLKAAGVKAFRMSTAWPRIQPDGPGAPNQAGLDLYARIIDAMLERGIDPWVTLFHWDTPVWAGNFLSRDIAGRLADYAGIVTKHLGDRVKNWITFNEPGSVALLGYGSGEHAPGFKSPLALVSAIHHQNLSIGLMAKAARAHLPSTARLGTTHIAIPVRPETPGKPDDVAAAARMHAIANTAFLDPLFGKGYPDSFAPLVAPLVKPGDLDTIATKFDFLGVNYYARLYVRGVPGPVGFEVAEAPKVLPRTAMQPVEPDGLTEALVWASERYGPMPIYVTETGFALRGETTWDSGLKDQQRLTWLDQYLGAAARARAQGVDLRGLFYWSATDNWEWAQGFAKRFGLIAVDPATQARANKRSLARYAALVRKHFPDV